MNLRARLKNASIYATLWGTAGMIVGGGVATLIYYGVYYPSDVWNAAVQKACDALGCSYHAPTFLTRAYGDCYLPYQPYNPNQPYRECEYPKGHDMCRENEVIAESETVFAPFAEKHSHNTIEFMYKFAAPIGLGVGAIAGAIIGFSKTPASKSQLAESLLATAEIKAEPSLTEVVVTAVPTSPKSPKSRLKIGLFSDSFEAAVRPVTPKAGERAEKEGQTVTLSRSS